jgi:PBP1b-binding outer membrane lipoprotein LpoB
MADKITDIIGQEAFAQVEKLKSELKQLNDAFENSAKVALMMNNALSNSKGITETSNAIKKQQSSLSEIERLQAKLIYQTTETARVEAELRLEIQRLTMANKDYVKSQQAKEGSINSLRVQLKALQNQYDAMASAERESAKGTDLIKHLKDVDAELKKLEAGSGRFQRNVGNYASGWSPLSNAIGQITRELPNFGQSLQIGVMSLTNNIGALQDAIKGINEQNKVLKSEGKTTTSALSQIAGALFSWNTVLYVGIGLLSAYSKEIFAFIGNLLKSESEISILAEAQKGLNEAILKGSKNAVSEVNELERLYETTQDVTLSINERKLAIDKLQKIYPTYFGNIEDEKILNGEATATYYHLRDAIVASARAKAIKTKIDEIVSDGLETELELIEAQAQAIEKYNKNKGKFIQVGAVSAFSSGIETDETRLKNVQNREKDLSDFYKNQNKKLKIYEDNLKETQKVTAKYGDPYAKAPKEPKTPKPKAEPKEAEVNRINEIKKQYEREQKELETSFKNKTITEEEFYYQSIQKATKFIEERIGLSKKEHETEIDFNIDLNAKATDFHNKLIENSLKELETSKYVYGQQEDIAKKNFDKRFSFIQKLADEDLKRGNDIIKKAQDDIAKQVENYKIQKQAREDLLDKSIEATAEISRTVTDRLMADIERLAELKLQSVDAQEQAELASLDRLTLSENERAEKKKQIELEAEARRKAIEKEKIKDLRKFALIQKGVDVAEIISSTALAIMRQLGNVADQANGSAIPKAIGIGITGAVQLAKVLATPLPQYAEGIESTPTDSFAIVGEKGTELITEKSGKQYLTPNKDTLTYLPKGTKVTPHHELMANVYDNAHKYMASNSSVTTDTMQTALIQSFEELYNKVDNLTEIMAKKNMNVSIFGDYEHAMRIKKSRM